MLSAEESFIYYKIIMTDFEKLRRENPIIIWKKRLTFLTRLMQGKYINKAKKVLDNFISELENIKNKDSVEINRVVKETVLKLNELNEFGEFIDTLEREDICFFISKAATEAGLTINKGEDITQEYRTW